MKKRFILQVIVLFSVFFVLLLSGCGSPGSDKQGAAIPEKQEAKATGAYTVTDLTGTKVAFSEKPKKILTFAMYTDQIVLGLVTSDHLVGINTLLDDPVLSNIIPIAKKVKRKIGNPGAEEVLAMKPDVVIVSDWTQAEKI